MILKFEDFLNESVGKYSVNLAGKITTYEDREEAEKVAMKYFNDNKQPGYPAKIKSGFWIVVKDKSNSTILKTDSNGELESMDKWD